MNTAARDDSDDALTRKNRRCFPQAKELGATGFTLIELLVVIAIIAILIVMMMDFFLM